MTLTKKLHGLMGPAIILVMAMLIYFAYRHVSEEQVLSGVSNGLEKQCEFVNKTCHIRFEEGAVTAQFSELPEAEESITVQFALPEGMLIESVWIEGVNMYMGKIPVLVSQGESGKWEGWFMLGACSEPQMQWRMLLNIKGRRVPAYLYFTTTR